MAPWKELLDPHRDVYAARGLESRISLAIEGLERHVTATDSRCCQTLSLIADIWMPVTELTPDEESHHSFEAGASSFQDRSTPLPADAAGSFDEHT